MAFGTRSSAYHRYSITIVHNQPEKVGQNRFRYGLLERFNESGPLRRSYRMTTECLLGVEELSENRVHARLFAGHVPTLRGE